MTDLGRAVAVALAALGDDGAALRGAWSAPWRVVVVGGRGVGKTTLVNALAGSARPTGLGGVTDAVAVVDVPGTALVDTPGIDGPAAWLPDALGSADAVIWLVDPLRALPWSERTEVEAALPAGVGLHVRIARYSGIDEEAPEILDRVERLVAPWRPRSVGWWDRAATPTGLLIRSGAGPARRARIRAAIADASAAAARADHGSVRAAWRDAVRAVEAAAAAHLDADRSLTAGAVLSAAARAVALPADLPLPPKIPAEPHPLRALWASPGADRRELRAAAARWLADAELALGRRAALVDRPRAAARAALADLAAALDPGHAERGDLPE